MSTFTLYPSAYLSGMDATFYGEAPYTTTPETIRQYLADVDDATFAERSSPPGYIVTQQVTFELPNPTIPADEFIARVEGFARWSQGGSGVFVGAAPYLGATPPSSIPYVTTDGRVTPTTSTPFVQNVAWNAVDANNCNLLWLEGSQEDLAWVRTHQIGARLKTIKHSTCTVVDKTTLIDATPVISVPVTSTLDWESAEPVNSALRKVDVEMRIELGGTVPESGTLIGTATDTFQLAATGTVTRLLTATDPIPNGTYKVYARATRNRATGEALADQVGPWSAGATLIVNVPLPTTPTVFVIEEEFGDSVTVSATPVATTSYTEPTVDVERSDDDRVTWKSVRSGSGVVGAFGQPVDVTDVELTRAGHLLANLATNPSFESSSGPTVVRTNLVGNPRAISAGGLWGSLVGGGGTGVGSFLAAGGPAGVLDSFFRNTITSDGSWARVQHSSTPVNAGTQYTISGWIRTSLLGRDFSLIAQWRAGASLLSESTTIVPAPTGAWTRVSLTVVAPPTATAVFIQLGVTNGAVAGATIDGTGVLLEVSPTLGAYFDGATEATSDLTFEWSGAANASSSNAVGQAAAGVADGGGGVFTKAFQSSEWASTGARSLRIVPIGAGGPNCFAQLSPVFQVGRTYTVMAKLRLSAPLASPDGAGRRMEIRNSVDSAVIAISNQAPNDAGVHDLAITFVATQVTNRVRLNHRGASNTGDLWWDDVVIIEGSYAGEYFDGNHAPAGMSYASWAGAANASISYAAERTPPFYRARVSALYDGETINASPWSTPTPVGLAADGWNLKAVEVPGLAFVEVPVIGEIIQELDEDVGVFRPLDRRLPVVVAGELTGYDGSLEIRLTEQWQWETLKSLIEAQRVLLMQRPYGDQQYIRFVDKRSIGLWGTPTNPQRRVILKYVETGAP